MREILFRGKRLGTDEWVYGYYNMVSAEGKDYHYICWQGSNTPVAPETVGQDTGIDDKNGVSIFEGDFVAYPDYSKGVFFGKGQPIAKTIVRYEKIFNGYGYIYLDNESEDLEVVGNIHDKPELL